VSGKSICGTVTRHFCIAFLLPPPVWGLCTGAALAFEKLKRGCREPEIRGVEEDEEHSCPNLLTTDKDAKRMRKRGI
jgi:hypothetical protein